MAKKKSPKKSSADKSRRERLDEMRRQQQVSERRRTAVIVGAFALVGAIIIGAAAYIPVTNWINDPSRKPASDFGVAAEAAACTDPEVDEPEGVAEHLDGQDIVYDSAPPAFGPHWSQPAAFERKFYRAEDRPPLEQLVHNLEHGYTIVWYDESIAEDDEQLDLLETISRRFSAQQWDGESDNKFIAAPWESADGDFPDDKPIALSRWTEDAGVRVYCSEISAEAIEQFMAEYPWTDAPEPMGL